MFCLHLAGSHVPMFSPTRSRAPTRNRAQGMENFGCIDQGEYASFANLHERFSKMDTHKGPN